MGSMQYKSTQYERQSKKTPPNNNQEIKHHFPVPASRAGLDPIYPARTFLPYLKYSRPLDFREQKHTLLANFPTPSPSPSFFQAKATPSSATRSTRSCVWEVIEILLPFFFSFFSFSCCWSAFFLFPYLCYLIK